jgi:glycosyltransferase involved in cell wall biosynthesis
MFNPLYGRKILFLFGSLDMGGAERQGLLLARHLRHACGARVQVWGLSERTGHLAELCDREGIAWRAVPFHWGLSRRLWHFPRFLSLLRRERPEITISYTCVPNLVAALGWRLAGVQACLWNQADEGLLLNRLPLHRLALRQPSSIVSNSTGGKRFLEETYGLPPGRVQLIRNGVVLPKPELDRAAWRQRLGVDEGTLVATMVANLSRHKDHNTLVRAWAGLLAGWQGPLPVLALAGRFDGAEADVLRIVGEAGVAGQVRLLGPVDDVAGLLAASDLFVYSSRSEGIPNAVLEAMAAGLPVAGTDIPGIREAVGEAVASFLAPVGDAAALAGMMGTLLAEAGLRRTLGEALKQRVEEEFSAAAMCNRTVACLLKALEGT